MKLSTEYSNKSMITSTKSYIRIKDNSLDLVVKQDKNIIHTIDFLNLFDMMVEAANSIKNESSIDLYVGLARRVYALLKGHVLACELQKKLSVITREDMV